MEKIMNWYDVNGRIDIFFNLYFELLKIEIFIKYLRTFYTPLQILNIVEAFIEYGRAERRVADKII